MLLLLMLPILLLGAGAGATMATAAGSPAAERASASAPSLAYSSTSSSSAPSDSQKLWHPHSLLPVLPTLPGLLGIHHFALAVPVDQLESQVEAYKSLGFQELHREDVLGSDQVREVLLHPALQILSPLSPDSPVARQLRKPCPAFAHLALKVADIHAAYAHFQANGYHLLDPAPRPGSHGTTVFFVHPKSPAQAPLGYLLEIVQDPA